MGLLGGILKALLTGAKVGIKAPFSGAADLASKVSTKIGATKAGQAVKGAANKVGGAVKKRAGAAYDALDDSEVLKTILLEAADQGLGALDENGNPVTDTLRTVLRLKALHNANRGYSKFKFNRQDANLRQEFMQKFLQNPENTAKLKNMTKAEQNKLFREQAIASKAGGRFPGFVVWGGIGGTAATKYLQKDLPTDMNLAYPNAASTSNLADALGIPNTKEGITNYMLAEYNRIGQDLQKSKKARNLAQSLANSDYVLPPIWSKKNRKDEYLDEDTPNMTFSQHIATLMSPTNPHFAPDVKLDFGKYTSEQLGLLDTLMQRFSPEQLQTVGKNLKITDPDSYKTLQGYGWFNN